MKWRRLQYSKRRSGRKKEAVKTANQSKTGPNLNLCPIAGRPLHHEFANRAAALATECVPSSIIIT
jgi:hypothetical protein